MTNENTAAHTPEPLSIGDSGMIYDALAYEYADPYGATPEQRAEHARRIVACVNACAGIPTETLEGDQDALKAAVSLREEAIEQRDALADALRLAQATLERVNPKVHNSCQGTLDVIGKALASL